MLTTKNFIKRFLQIIALLHIVVGLCFPWIVESSLFDYYKQHIDQVFNIDQDNARQQASFLIAIFGPTIASWGVLFLFVIYSSFSSPTPQAWWALLLACMVWAPYDSFFSLLNGVYFNAIINAIAFVMMVTPLLIVRKHFFAPINVE